MYIGIQLTFARLTSLELCIYVFVYTNLQSVTAESIGATELLNYTRDSVAMYHYVQQVENLSQCCNYSYQILDRFCARQAMVSVF